MRNSILRIIASIIGLGIFSALVVLGFPRAKTLVTSYRISYRHYQPSGTITPDPTVAQLPAAKAVPILLYHGVTKTVDSDNTTIETFESQMEMLKREGYTTISLHDLDLFYQGKFTLPPRPIILTFDDARKDSYYPTDDLLRQFGYSATMFVVTGRTLAQNSFFLSWDELAKLRDSGRWDIQAHGRESHDKITIDEQGSIGHFLSSRIYTKGKGLESVADYEHRIEVDYQRGRDDLEQYLGVHPEYYAVPLNDYGSQPVSNYPEAGKVNNAMVKKFFRMGLIEALVYNPLSDATYLTSQNRARLYNYADQDPFATVRIEPKNMRAELLRDLLTYKAPKLPVLQFSPAAPEALKQQVTVAYGQETYDQQGLHFAPAANTTAARMLIGDEHWENYQVDAQLMRKKGRSFNLLVDAHQNDQAVAIGLSDRGVYVKEVQGDNERILASSVAPNIQNGTSYQVHVEVRTTDVSVDINGQRLFSNVPVSLTKGALGLKVWDDLPQAAEGVVQSLQLQPLAS